MSKHARFRFGEPKGFMWILATAALSAFIAGCAIRWPTTVEVYGGGDDGLSNRLVDLVREKIEKDPRASPDRGNAGGLRIYLVGTVKLEQAGPDANITYEVMFASGADSRRSLSTGSCKKKRLDGCADQIITAAWASLK